MAMSCCEHLLAFPFSPSERLPPGPLCKDALPHSPLRNTPPTPHQNNKTVTPRHTCSCLLVWLLKNELSFSFVYINMSKLFSLEGKGLKLTTAEDIEPHIQVLKENDDVEEVRFLGNTLGIEACEALAKVLETKKSLKVR